MHPTRARWLTAAASIPLMALFTASCASKREPADLPPRDSSVVDLLPAGTYTVTGGQVDMENPISLEGFVDFGTKPDGVDCESSYTLRVPEGYDSEGPRTIESVRAAGEEAWYRDAADAGNPGEWLDNANPRVPYPVFLFIPQIITGDGKPGILEGAGVGTLCSIPIMPRFMRVGEDGALLFDQPRVVAAHKAAADRWDEMFVDAVGLTGSVRDAVLANQDAVELPTFKSLLEGTSIKMVETGEGFTLTLYKENGQPGRILIELRFVRAADRDVPKVDGVTIFEEVAADIRANPDLVEELDVPRFLQDGSEEYSLRFGS